MSLTSNLDWTETWEFGAKDTVPACTDAFMVTRT
jgi:hypothetical protein